MTPHLCILALFLRFSLGNAQQTFWPAAIPLAVRTPYLNTWQLTENGTTNPHTTWSTFWTRKSQTAWTGFIRVDNTIYRFLGHFDTRNPNVTASSLESTAITPTQTILRIICGPVVATVTFLSPIEPSDYTKQSFPFSYMFVDVESSDGNTHAIRLYVDITGQWVSNNPQNMIQWGTNTTDTVLYHSIRRQTLLNHVEDANMSEDSTFYFATLSSSNVVWQTGGATAIRNQIRSGGTLKGGEDTAFRAIGDQWPAFAYEFDLGTITKTASPIVLAIGQDHDPSVLYSLHGQTNQERSPYWKLFYRGDITGAITDFLNDFPHARDRAVALDKKVLNAAKIISPTYADLVSLAARQTMAGLEITTDNRNASDIKTFMKNMGGQQPRINPVEIIYSAMPMFLYIDAAILGHLLDPLLEYQASSKYTNPYAAPDLGTFYPNAVGNARSHSQGLEQSANMLIMSLAHARYSGNGAMLSRYYPLFKRWADYLVDNALYPTNQTTADGLVQPGNVNLAVKGIIAIKAMSEISKAVNMIDHADTYSATASSMVGQWQSLAMPNDRLLLLYNNTDSDGLFYNLYADKLLKLNLIPQQVYTNQANYYSSQTQSTFGPIYDNGDPNVVKPHWTMFTAAAIQNYPVANTLINLVNTRASTNSSVGVFPASYRSEDGRVIDGEASPALGAMFAFLALGLEPKDIVAPPLSEGSFKGSSSNAGVIAGVVAGIVVGLTIVGVTIIVLRRKEARPKQQHTNPTPFMSHPQISGVVTPFNLPNSRGDGGKLNTPPEPVDTAEVTRMQLELANLRGEIHAIREYGPPPHYPA